MFKVIALGSLQNNDSHKRIALDQIMSILSRKVIQRGRLLKDSMLDVSSYDLLRMWRRMVIQTSRVRIGRLDKIAILLHRIKLLQ